MPATRTQVVFDCADPDRLAHFWAEALHYVMQPPPEGFATWEDWLRSMDIPESEWNRASAIVDPDGVLARIYFQRVPEAKQGKNRVHLDLNQGERGIPLEERRRLVDAEVDRLKSLGATELYHLDGREYCVTMADPEGNEFCVQ